MKEKIIAAILLTSLCIGGCANSIQSSNEVDFLNEKSLNENSNKDNSSNDNLSNTVSGSDSSNNLSNAKEAGEDNGNKSSISVNESIDDKTASIYQSFLKNESKATLNEDFKNDTCLTIVDETENIKDSTENIVVDSSVSKASLDTEKGFTLDELCNLLNNSYKDEDIDDTTSYAYIDFGDDGNYELVVKYEMYEYTEYFVFSASSGDVELMYGVDQGGRWSANVLDNGYINQYGSGGAGSHSGFEGGLDAKGLAHIFKEEYQVYYGWSIYGFSKDDEFNEIINTWSEEKDYRQSSTFCFAAVRIGEDEYYCYSCDDSENNITDSDIKELISLGEEQGIDIIDYSDIDAKVADYQKKEGMEDITFDNGSEIEFTELNS